MDRSEALPVAAYLVLSLLAEGEAHGYKLQRQARDRGFRFWTDLQRSSIYSALARLEKQGLVRSRRDQGGGPARKVYGITASGRRAFHEMALLLLREPRHPRNELDLGVLGLPYLDPRRARAAMEEGIDLLRQREAFVSRQLRWCAERRLELPALNFQRPLGSIAGDRSWLQALRDQVIGRKPARGEWQQYEYVEPEYVDKEDPQ